jgi:hypothetical protein
MLYTVTYITDDKISETVSTLLLNIPNTQTQLKFLTVLAEDTYLKFLGAFANLRKPTISFGMSVCFVSIMRNIYIYRPTNFLCFPCAYDIVFFSTHSRYVDTDFVCELLISVFISQSLITLWTALRCSRVMLVVLMVSTGPS